jgi:hypothetical protein
VRRKRWRSDGQLAIMSTGSRKIDTHEEYESGGGGGEADEA